MREIARLLDLAPISARKANGLTADAKQKISLGRGLVRADVAAILFDEPLTVIDPALKWELRSKLKVLHRALDLTMIYVTHDQTEALTFADTVVVMHEGSVVQTGTPEELFVRPDHTFVGYFIGSPGMNVLPAEVRGPPGAGRRPRLELARSYGELPAGRAHRNRHPPRFVSIAAPAPGLLSASSSASTISAAAASRVSRGRPQWRPACRRACRSPAARPAWSSIRRRSTSMPIHRRDRGNGVMERSPTRRPGCSSCRCSRWWPSRRSSR